MSFKYFHRNFYKLFVYVFPLLFIGVFVREPAFAISRTIPDTTEIPVPIGAVVSGSCPSELLPNHISICGIAKTIDINIKDEVQYAQQPIKGATVAAYLGVQYAGLGSLSGDPNNTGELVGLIERLYTYDITNDDGRFILPVPRGKGTDRFIFLGFFCGDKLKDLYMIDTSQDLPYMPVSLACPPEATPAAVNSIPAPPSINYADRIMYTSCEDKPGEAFEISSNPGMLFTADKTAIDPLEVRGLDNTRVGARVTQDVTYTCVPSGSGFVVAGAIVPVPGTEYFHEDLIGNGFYLEVPEAALTLSRRDLEGFTHTSMGYSYQAISSLNCGISGCYNTLAPTSEHDVRKFLDMGMVKTCNTEIFPPLNCKGPGIELAEPGEWSKSYDLQTNVEIYPGIMLGDITQPQYSSLGQLIQDILDAFGIVFTVGPLDTVISVINRLEQMLGAIDEAALTSFSTYYASFNSFVTAFNAFRNGPLSITEAINLVATAYDVVTNFYSAVFNIGHVILSASIPPDVQAAYNTVHDHALAIRDLVVNLFNNPPTSLAEVQAWVNEVGAHIDGIIDSLNIVANKVAELLDLAGRIHLAIEAILDIHLTTESSDIFPYSTVLNYDINKRFRDYYLNGPSNDSYKNPDGSNSFCTGNGELSRMVPSIDDGVAKLPFNVCYGAFLLGEDTYSTQKALYTTTKNTTRKVSNPDGVIDPVVSKFLAPKEPVGVEVAPKADALVVTSVADTPKVGGKGYWRLGAVRTMCSHGQNDYDVNTYVDYPVLAIFGEEGEMRAKPQYSQ
jgi:hypothetical protein